MSMDLHTESALGKLVLGYNFEPRKEGEHLPERPAGGEITAGRGYYVAWHVTRKGLKICQFVQSTAHALKAVEGRPPPLMAYI